MHSPELAKIATAMMECDVLGALGEAQRHLPHEAYKRLHTAVYTLAQDAAEKEREALRRIDEWAKAYPLDVFPEPDLKRAHEVLEAAGLSLGQISAQAMRHVLTGVQKIAAAAMAG